MYWSVFLRNTTILIMKFGWNGKKNPGGINRVLEILINIFLFWRALMNDPNWTELNSSNPTWKVPYICSLRPVVKNNLFRSTATHFPNILTFVISQCAPFCFGPYYFLKRERLLDDSLHSSEGWLKSVEKFAAPYGPVLKKNQTAIMFS